MPDRVVADLGRRRRRLGPVSRPQMATRTPSAASAAADASPSPADAAAGRPPRFTSMRMPRSTCGRLYAGGDADVDSVDDVRSGARRARLPGRRGSGDGDLPRPAPAPAAAARGRGRRRQDRGGQGARRAGPAASSFGSSATRASTSPRPCTSGTTPASCSTCAPPRPPAHVGADATSRTSSTRSGSWCAGRCCGRSTTGDGPAARAADRRGRPRRRRVRGVPARGAVRLRGHRSRARHVPRRRRRRSSSSRRTAPATCTTRSSGAACTTGSSIPTSSARSPSCALARARASSEPLARQVAAAVADDARAGALQAAGCRRDDRLGRSARRARRATSSTSASFGATLGTVLKYREDQERVRTAPASALRSRARPSAMPRRGAATPPVAVAFVRVLRGAGLDVPVGSTLVFVEALAAVGTRRRDRGLLGRPGDARAPAGGHRPSTTGRSPCFWERDASRSRAARGRPLEIDARDRHRATTTRRCPTGRRPRPTTDDRAALQPGRGAAPQGLRRLLRRRAGRGAAADVATCASSARRAARRACTACRARGPARPTCAAR